MLDRWQAQRYNGDMTTKARLDRAKLIAQGNPGSLVVLVHIAGQPSSIADTILGICESHALTRSSVHTLFNDVCGRSYRKMCRALMALEVGDLQFTKESLDCGNHNSILKYLEYIAFNDTVIADVLCPKPLEVGD